MLLQKVCAYIRVFFRWEFFFGETATAQENIFFVINWKTSRCEARTWRDVINEFEIDLWPPEELRLISLHINVTRKICQTAVFMLVYTDMNKTYILIISNRSEY